MLRHNSVEDFQDGEDAYYRGDYTTALKKLRLLAEQGHARAQYRLGVMYADGRGVPQDDIEAVKWFRKALKKLRLLAEQGDAGAQFSLGGMYYNGWGVQKDEAEAVKWFRKALKKLRLLAEQGDAGAQFSLGGMYYNGWGVQKDEAEAVKWFRKTAVQGQASAQNNLGLMYATGMGVQQDSVEAHKWFSLAAAQGVKGASENRDRVAKIKSILATGDGSRERPYVVSGTNEEYLILEHFNKTLVMQALVDSDEKRMDMMACEDGTAYYFNISTFYGRLR